MECNSKEPESQSPEKIDVEDAIKIVNGARFQMIITLCCGIGYTSDTVELVFIAFVLPIIEKEFQMTRWDLTFASVSSTIGILCGALIWGRIADRWVCEVSRFHFGCLSTRKRKN